jgi:hypothetical protein
MREKCPNVILFPKEQTSCFVKDCPTVRENLSVPKTRSGLFTRAFEPDCTPPTSFLEPFRLPGT